jgi:NNP family nitrate/nitrite transporter-like MFS transporter
MLLFTLVTIALVWMHVAIRIMERRKIPELRGPKYLPELDDNSPATVEGRTC